jgi:hypothetical protein
LAHIRSGQAPQKNKIGAVFFISKLSVTASLNHFATTNVSQYKTRIILEAGLACYAYANLRPIYDYGLGIKGRVGSYAVYYNSHSQRGNTQHVAVISSGFCPENGLHKFMEVWLHEKTSSRVNTFCKYGISAEFILSHELHKRQP